MWKITKIWTFLVSVLSCLRYIHRGRDWLTVIQKFQLLSFVIFLQFLHVSRKKAKVYQHKDFFIIFILFIFFKILHTNQFLLIPVLLLSFSPSSYTILIHSSEWIGPPWEVNYFWHIKFWQVKALLPCIKAEP